MKTVSFENFEYQTIIKNYEKYEKNDLQSIQQKRDQLHHCIDLSRY